MEKKDILETLINYYCDGNKAKFAGMLGVKPQTINTWIVRNSFDVDLLYSKCKDVSGDWLLSGEGEMLKSIRFANNSSEEIISLKNEIERLRKLKLPHQSDKVLDVFMKFMDVSREMAQIYNQVKGE